MKATRKQPKISDSELAEALRLNERLARKRSLNRADDLIGAGHSAIMSALNKFNRSKGVKFSTYCYCWILRNQNREFTDICKGLHLPHETADYPQKAGAYTRCLLTEEISDSLITEDKYLDSYSENLKYALTLLPPFDRQLIQTHFYEEIPYRKMTKTLKMDERAVSRLMNIAISQLSEIMRALDNPANYITSNSRTL